MTVRESVTYCRICEPCCGLVATVEDGRLTRLRPDPDHPITRGFACPKGIEMVHVQNDPDRVLHPLRRCADGTFEQVSWESALDDIGTRLGEIRRRHGGESIGWYAGNPSAFSHSHALWSKGFVEALGSRHFYTPNTQDTSSRFTASALLYGNPTVVPIPDLERTSFLLIVGANPLVSHASLISVGRVREKLQAIVARGGRVVVVDPRRTETAQAFEHLPIRPDGDAWLLLSVLHVLFDEGLTDTAAIARQSRGVEALRRTLAARCAPEATEPRTGIPAEQVRALARDLARAPSAAVYGRTGACLGRFATLVNVLLDTLNLVTGNLDRPGGAVFGRPPIDLSGFAARAGAATYDTYRSRVGGLPEVLGQLPAPLMAAEIETPGRGQLRALVVSAGNPVLSVPNGERLERALGTLDLQIGIDFYVNETHRQADYVLPAATFLERGDIPVATLEFHLKPFVQWTDPVVEPAGEAREDWQIIDELGKRLGIVPLPSAVARRLRTGFLGAAAVRVAAPLSRALLTPDRLIDVGLRLGRDGDRFGLRRGGLSLARLRQAPHGVVLAEHVETGVLADRVRHRGGKVALGLAQIRAELDRLGAEPVPDPDLPLLLIGQRELRSHNSWMHNTPRFRDPARRQVARVHPKDAALAGLADGDRARIVSAHGAIDLPVRLTDEVSPGTVAVPHGWGHRGGWQVANAAGGANVNRLTSDDPGDLEGLSGMSHLNGIPVRLERAAALG